MLLGPGVVNNIHVYCGAKGRIDPGQLSTLGSSWVVQPKHDGVYAELRTDSAGNIACVLSRTGKPLSHSLPAPAIANAVLVGELEAMTERSQDAVARRGHQRLHLFDALAVGGRQLEGSYSERRDELQRAVAAAELRTLDASGRVHDDEGRFSAKTWRYYSVVEQVTARYWERLYADVMSAGGEGIVAVNTRARCTKRKHKPVDHESMTVVRCDAKTVELVRWGQRRGIVVSKGRHNPRPGDMVDVAVEGWYRSGLPRFARIVRVRGEL